MRIPIDLRELEVFVAVATARNFSRAALTLHVSQSALSRSVRIVEHALGARLFDRNTRSVKLTPTGNELLPVARRILSEFDESLSGLSQFIKGRRGQIKISVVPSVASILTTAITQFCVDRPDVGFLVRTDPAAGVLAAVTQGDVDIGVTAQPPPAGTFQYRHLMDDSYVLVCRPDDPLARAARSPVGWDVFQKSRYIASAKGTSTRTEVDAVFTKLGLVPRPVHESTSLPIIGGLIAAGGGITALPAMTFALLDEPALVTRSLKAPKLTRRLGIVTRAGQSQSSVAVAFLDELATVARTRRSASR
jgi:LysR family transcriptional regulator, carnitine catabolism transcriptional activator